MGGDLRHIRELARGFEGAWPYLELIARANGLSDPLDGRVVEAYWLGNELLDGVPVAMMADSLDSRFKARLRPEPWRWLAGKAPAGARPVHAFHVFDVFPRVGLMRGGEVTNVLATIDSCRIRWGTVAGTSRRPIARGRRAAHDGGRSPGARRAATGGHPRLARWARVRGRCGAG